MERRATQEHGKIQYSSIRETKWRANIDGTITVNNTITGTGIVPIKKLNVQSKKRQLETSRQDRRQYATLRNAQGNTSNLCLPCISLIK